jgi:DNA-binding NtrC family response regulator
MMMAQSVLFGHLRGSFTGAVRDSVGLFRAANKGVLFLDEVGELSFDAQALMLRVLETRAVQAVGQIQAEPVDVQLVLATHRDLPAEIAAGRFRNDLWSRIGGLKIRLAPLGTSARRGDIRPLLVHFIARHEKDLQKKTGGLTPEAFRALMAYSWPNNVREVDNVCMALVTYAKPGARIDLVDVEGICPEVIRGPRHPDAGTYVPDDASYDEAFRIWETEFLRSRIEHHDGNLKEAARALGVSEMTFLRYRRRCGLVRKDEDSGDA